MGLFNRKGNKSENEPPKEKGAWRKPANTAFKQQRLKAWQPILTPKTVLPTLFIIAVIFAPIGGLLVWGSSQVSEMTFDYTNCENLPSSSDMNALDLKSLPTNEYSYKMRAADVDSTKNIKGPQYAYFVNDAAAVGKKRQCILEFQVPADLKDHVFLYYKLTNFYQNHRRYVKSLDSDQLKGEIVSKNTIQDGNCKPLAVLGDKIIYPCGLIANSYFNDSYSPLELQGGPTDSSSYVFSEKGIAWSGERKKYAAKTKYPLSDIVPPPNWRDRYPEYNETNPPPDLSADEHFHNWMRTAGLPTFTKLWGHNDADTLRAGRYRMVIDLNFPVLPYKGTKSIVISTVSWIGGKNPFLGWAYVAAAGLFVLLAVAGTIRHLVKPRRLGDMSLLSWNQ